MPPRATPMPAEERRRALLDAARPLVAEHGRGVTTKSIALAAGVAEGTLFRVFTSKDELVDAVVADVCDPDPFLRRLADLPRDGDLDARLVALVTAWQERFRAIVEVMSAVGAGPPDFGRRHDVHRAHGQRADHPDDWRAEVRRHVVDVVGEDAARLRVSPQRLGHYLRMLAFAGSHHRMSDAERLTPEEIVALLLHGALDETTAPTTRTTTRTTKGGR